MTPQDYYDLDAMIRQLANIESDLKYNVIGLAMEAPQAPAFRADLDDRAANGILASIFSTPLWDADPESWNRYVYRTKEALRQSISAALKKLAKQRSGLVGLSMPSLK